MNTQLVNIQTASPHFETIDLTSFDLIALNSSGGKDSSVMCWYVRKLAEEQGVLDRLVIIHATFAEEWDDAEEVARKQAELLGIRFYVVTKGKGTKTPATLLEYAAYRQKWPDNRNRWCTSDFKRGPINKMIRRLCPRGRVLSVLGIRGQESNNRAKKDILCNVRRECNSRRTVQEWLPIFHLAESEVWAIIRENEISIAEAYKLGFSRLSCRICIFANRNTLLAAAWAHPELFENYVRVEREIGHRFKNKLSLAEIWEDRLQGVKPSGPLGFEAGL
jgi:3'-phosphoadenosine 5'-phosphosulfate sulfotransferase (PAPS reductase)/FAD synthetase